MSLILDGGRVPDRWAEIKDARVSVSDSQNITAGCLRIGFVNNMPDSALDDTELQFFELLDRAAANIPILLRIYSLPEIPRGDRAQQHIKKFYFSLKELWDDSLDALIVTGTEPKSQKLQEEPYWSTLATLLEWAECNTSSTILSCLAAHASVLRSDGISRHALPDKQFGVFPYVKPQQHPLTRGTSEVVSIPHSRWNEVRANDLEACGYTVLTKSAETGVDLFVKGMGKSLFVHFQGHPEYSTRTLMKEYRRDVRRYLMRERETYPSPPERYFDAAATKLLNQFKQNAEIHRNEQLLTSFPEAMISETVKNTWQDSARQLYGNWLGYLSSRKFRRPSRFTSAIASSESPVRGYSRSSTAIKRAV